MPSTDYAKATYETAVAIPEIGAVPGDVILIEPDHPEAPLLAIREFHLDRLPVTLTYLDRMALVGLDNTPGSGTPSSVRRWLSAYVPRGRLTLL